MRNLSSEQIKHESADRIFRLLQFLLANECTRKDVFERLPFYYKIDPSAPPDGSRRADRMFERDIKFLQEQGFEITKKKAKGQLARYSLVKGSGPRATFLFTEADVDYLALLHTLFADPARYAHHDPTQPLPFQPTHNPFAQEMLALIEKLIATLPTDQRKNFDRWVRKPYLYFDIPPVTYYLPHRATIDVIVHAISAHQQVQFEYMPTHHNQNVIHHEHIDPYYIILLEGHFYLIGYSQTLNQFQEYRVDSIKGETLKMLPAKIDTEQRQHPVEFAFWIDSHLARRGLNHRWLTQRLEREEVHQDEHGQNRRRILVRASAYNESRIIQQILTYGDHAELVEPLHLREKMKETVRHMYQSYA